MEFFDAHVHLQTLDNLPELMEQAKQAGFVGFICNSTSPADWDKVLEISEVYEGVYPCLGVHPLYVENLPSDWLSRLEELLRGHPTAMVGEIGLDKNGADLDFQEKVFRAQLELANDLGCPAHIHCVRSWDRLFHVFKTEKDKGKMPPMIVSHSHHGDKDWIPMLIKEYNAYFSYSSIFVPDNRPKVRACLKATPLDRLLIESDAMKNEEKNTADNEKANAIDDEKSKEKAKAKGLSRSPLDIIGLLSEMLKHLNDSEVVAQRGGPLEKGELAKILCSNGKKVTNWIAEMAANGRQNGC